MSSTLQLLPLWLFPAFLDFGCLSLTGSDHIRGPSFKFETVDTAAKLMRPGDYMFVLDMKAGYHQIPLKPSFKRFCCFEWGGRVYRWNVLPFGISTAPRAYSKLSRLMLARWRAEGIRCSNYIADYIFYASSAGEAERLCARVLSDMCELGWHVNTAKSQLTPSQRVTYLGYALCSMPRPFLQVPPSKIRACRDSIRYLLSRRKEQGGSVVFEGATVARLTGSKWFGCGSLCVLIPLCSLTGSLCALQLFSPSAMRLTLFLS